MTVNTFSNGNVNPFNLSYVTQPNSQMVTTKNNVFIPQIIEQTRTQIPLESEQIKALNLKDNLLAKFLPQNFIAKYLNDGFIQKQIQNNPKIKEIIAQKGLKTETHAQNILNIINSHLIPTTNYAKLIMEKSGISFSMEDYSIMEQAGLLHDIGKIFIPPEILNKKNNLSPKERAIIELHDTLGVELLKHTTLSPQILTLIGTHHNYGGYEDNSILTQILRIADVYSALKETRAYKDPLTNDETFEILYKKAQQGEFDKKLVTVLKNALDEKLNTQKIVVA